MARERNIGTRSVRFSGLGTMLLLLAAWRIFDRRSRARIPSQEGIADAEISRAFGQISRLPQMQWVRRYVSSRAAALQAADARQEAARQEAARQEARSGPTGEAVDLGCGPGYLVIEMARRLPGLQITGLDLSQEMLTAAGINAWEAGVGDRVAFKLGDAQKIPCADGSLDLVVSTLSLHHWSDPAAVLDEIARVLKPGGAFLVFDLRRDLAMPFYLLLWLATQFIVPAALGHINEPMGSRNASYTPLELGRLASDSALRGWEVIAGPLWVILEGHKS